jgi:hypothetical protein
MLFLPGDLGHCGLGPHILSSGYALQKACAALPIVRRCSRRAARIPPVGGGSGVARGPGPGLVSDAAGGRRNLAGLRRSRCRRLRRHIRRCRSWGDSPPRGRSLGTRRRRGCSRWRRCSRWRGCSRAIRHAHVGSAAAALAETGAALGEGGSCGERERDSDRCEAFHDGWCLSGCLTYA